MKLKSMAIIFLFVISFARAADTSERLEPRSGNSGGASPSGGSEALSDKFPYNVGDVIGYTTANSSLATQKAAKIVSIKGKWIKIDGRTGYRNFSCWVNTDNLVEVWKE
jgi:hypothetical protein